jgi:transposase
MDLHLLVKVLKETLDAKSKMIVLLEQGNALKDELIDAQKNQIKNLEAENALLRQIKNSNNSHIPPSKDENRVRKNQSLREKTDRKPGGQLGHEGTTLECSNQVDQVIKHSPEFCSCCGNDLSATVETFISSRQIIDVPPIMLKRIEHQIFKKQCSCGYTMESNFPQYIANPVQYGPNVEALVGYLHTRQYLPYGRMQEFLKDVMGLPVSTVRWLENDGHKSPLG